MSGLNQYYVMKRPKHPTTGEIVRGKISGGIRNPDGSISEGSTLWFPASLTTAGANGTLMSTSAAMTGNAGKIDGDPWILHSVHFSIDEAISSSKPVISSVGVENVRILKTIAHDIKVILA